MDIKLEKKPWIVRYRWMLVIGILFLGILVYILYLLLSPNRFRIDHDAVRIDRVKKGQFVEYVEVEGVVQPILTLKVNFKESGIIKNIVKDEGAFVRRGDTLVVLDNPELVRTIEDKRDEWEKQRYTYEERMIEMEQKTLMLKRQRLETQYEIDRLQKSMTLEKEEFKMGIMSKAQLEVSEDEFNFKLKKAALEMQSLQHDSAVTVIRKELLQSDLNRERKKYQRSMERIDNLIVTAPVSGQLSFLRVIPGQQVSSGQSLTELKVLDDFMLHTQLSEYYIDRISTGLPASVSYQGESYPLKITRVVPEIKDRKFDVDLVFTEDVPDNVRVGKSFRVKIELGQPEEALMIPKGDFYEKTGGKWIYRVDEHENRAVKVPILIGRQNPRQYEILDGLKPGQLVITAGYEKLGDSRDLILK